MTGNILLRSIKLLQESISVEHPWSILVTKLLRLLKLYSTGLTLSIARDHFNHQRCAVLPRFSTYSARLVEVVDSPFVWQLHLNNGLQVAHFPHALFMSKGRPGLSLTIATAPSEPSMHTTAETDALRIAIAALSGRLVSHLAVHCPQDMKSIPQSAETPSQSANPLPTSVCFPTLAVLFHLDTFPLSLLGLTLPVHEFTLQRVWDTRDLAPPAVYARVVYIDVQSEIIGLQDSSFSTTSQPSVQFSLSGERASLINALVEGCRLLLLRPTVIPTGNSFNLMLNESTICFCGGYKEESCLNSLYNVRDEEFEIPPLAKRPRTDDDLSKTKNTVTIASVLALSQPELQPPLVVHTRLTKRPLQDREDLKTWILSCDEVNVKFHGFVSDFNHFTEGDELVLSGLQLRIGTNSKKEWVASQVDNLSTMSAVLFAPFVRSFVNGAEVRRRLAVGTMCTTAHVCVRVHEVEIKKCRQLRLAVIDISNGAGNASVEPWYISMNEHILWEVFRIECNDLWDNFDVEDMCLWTARFQKDTWMMTITCDSSRWAIAHVRACVSATPPTPKLVKEREASGKNYVWVWKSQ